MSHSAPSADVLAAVADRLRQLHRGLLDLQSIAAQCETPPVTGREWFEVLSRKLLPQVSDETFLVLAVVGGTNIGKSVIFNHLAGSRASATSPLASGTKHPTLIVPEGFAEQHDLDALFPGFELQQSKDAEQALVEDDRHLLFWRIGAELPDNLLVLDTPDIDSDARVNWVRADHIRQSADVLIAVLTQQKYNDAAVKEFFRKAAAEDKVVAVVFNRCDIEDDEEYWPLWMHTFCEETGIEPELVYLAPNDRRAAEENQLPFYERTWPQPDSSDEPEVGSFDAEPRDLMRDLSELKFGEIKVRTLHGSLDHVMRSVPRYLAEIELRAGEFGDAAAEITSGRLAEVRNWPTLPNRLLVTELRRWWQHQREGWSASVHGFYNRIGTGISNAFQFVREGVSGAAVDPWDEYRKREWENGVLPAVDEIYQNLTRLSKLGHDRLRPRLEVVLDGTSRRQLLDVLHEAHREVDLERELRETVRKEMSNFRQESPHHYEFFKKLDRVAAVARPAASVALIFTGAGPVGEVASAFVADGAIQVAVHGVGDAVGGSVAAVAADQAVAGGAAAGGGYIEAKFRKLHNAFAARRAVWLGELLHEHLLGSLPAELAKATAVPDSAQFQQVRELHTSLQDTLLGIG